MLGLLLALGWGIFQSALPGNINGPTVFSKLPVSGGGFVVQGPDINGSQILVGSDVYGCEKWNSGTSSWQELATTKNVGLTGAPGCYFVVAAPSNPNIIAMMIGLGNLYRSTDGGATFTYANFHHTVNPNGETGGFNQRMFGPKAAFDPNNSDVLYVATATDGVFLSTNFGSATAGSESFSAVTSVPTSSSTGYVMAFDANGGTTGGRSNIAYIGPYNNNLYQATTAPSGSTPPTFSSLGVSSTWQRISVDPQGTIWIVDGSNLNKVTGCRVSCTWAAQTTGLPDGTSAVAVDPNNCSAAGTCHVVVMGGGNGAACSSASGTISATPDGGTTWHAGASHSRASGDTPWLAETNEFNMCPGGIAIDSTGLLWFGEGVGVWTATPNYSTGGTNTVWTAKSHGITNMDALGVVSPPAIANQVSTRQWDRNTLTTDTVHEPSIQNVYAIVASIVRGNAMDVATSDGETLAVEAEAGGFDGSGVSPDGGATWNPFPVSTQGQVTLTATSTISAGGGGLVFAANSFDTHVAALMVVQDVTHPFSKATYVTGAVNPGAGTFGASAADGSGIPSQVTSGDTITVSWANSPFRRPLATNASTTSGPTLHFSSVPGWVHSGMLAASLTASSCIPGGGSPALVLSTTSTTVALDQSVTCTVPSADTILFSEQSGGSIAVSTPNNMVFIAANNSGSPVYTKDGGSTWNSLTMSGVEFAGSGCANSNTTITSYSGNANNLVPGETVFNPQGIWGSANTAKVVSIISSSSFTVDTNAVVTSCGALLVFENFNTSFLNPATEVCADRSTTGTFYIYNHAFGHVFKSTDNGDTWADQSSAVGGGGQNMASSPYNINGGSQQRIKCVPGQAGNLFMASGAADFNSTDEFARSTDGGKNWTAVSGVTGVNAFGFGAAKPGGGGYPAIYIAGYVNIAGTPTYGIYRSDDNAVTWNHLGNSDEINPAYQIALVDDIEGDKSVFGKVYGSFTSASFFCGALSPGC